MYGNKKAIKGASTLLAYKEGEKKAVLKCTVDGNVISVC